MTYPTLNELYPHLTDLFTNPAFRENHNIYSRNYDLNSWTLFWRTLTKTKYRCCRCGDPVKRGASKHIVCQHCRRQYLINVRLGVTKPVLFPGEELA